jgi:hypothetical protein
MCTVLWLQKQQARARRQRIPAFGEWNYSYGGDWPVTQYFDSAMQAGLVPPSPMPVKKVAESRYLTCVFFLLCLLLNRRLMGMPKYYWLITISRKY